MVFDGDNFHGKGFRSYLHSVRSSRSVRVSFSAFVVSSISISRVRVFKMSDSENRTLSSLLKERRSKKKHDKDTDVSEGGDDIDLDNIVKVATTGPSKSTAPSKAGAPSKVVDAEKKQTKVKIPMKSFQSSLPITDVEKELVTYDRNKRREVEQSKKVSGKVKKKKTSEEIGKNIQGKKRKEPVIEKEVVKKAKKNEVEEKKKGKKPVKKKSSDSSDEDYELEDEVLKEKEDVHVEHVKSSKVFQAIRVRTTPKQLFLALKSLSSMQRSVLDEMGFGSLSGMVCDGVTAKLGHFLVDRFNPKKMSLELKNGSLKITPEVIHYIFGVPKGGLDISELESVEPSDEMLVRWYSQFNSKLMRAKDISERISSSDERDQLFKLNIIMLFVNSIVDCKGSGVCKLNILPQLYKIENFQELDWCKYIYDCLWVSKVLWKPDDNACFYTGPILLLALVYLEFVRCDGFKEKPNCPALKYWTSDLMRERESYEISHGGFGNGELIIDFDLEAGHESTELEGYTYNIESKFNMFEGAVADALRKFSNDKKVLLCKKKLDLIANLEDEIKSEDADTERDTLTSSLHIDEDKNKDIVCTDLVNLSSELIGSKVDCTDPENLSSEFGGSKVDCTDPVILSSELGGGKGVSEVVAVEQQLVEKDVVDEVGVEKEYENDKVVGVEKQGGYDLSGDKSKESAIKVGEDNAFAFSYAFTESVSSEVKGLSSLECSDPFEKEKARNEVSFENPQGDAIAEKGNVESHSMADRGEPSDVIQKDKGKEEYVVGK